MHEITVSPDRDQTNNLFTDSTGSHIFWFIWCFVQVESRQNRLPLCKKKKQQQDVCGDILEEECAQTPTPFLLWALMLLAFQESSQDLFSNHASHIIQLYGL